MKRLMFSLAAGGLFFLSSQAVPANPDLREMTLPDGSSISVRLIGDEIHHFYQSEDGYPLMLGSDGYFYYMVVNEEGIATSSEIKYGSTSASVYNKPDKSSLYKALNREREQRAFSRNLKTRAPGASTFPTTGDIRGIVVLVEYQDVKFSISNPREAFDRLLNEPGYSDNDAYGSVYDWFSENSQGKFNPVFDVYGPLTLDYNMAYYGANTGGASDMNSHYMTIEACRQLDPEIDFTIYDCDGDGYIDNVYVFYAGYGEQDGGGADAVWPHSWDIGNFTNEVFDGVKLDHYACSNELDGKSVMTAIGVFCHEFGHVLGLPDLYTTVYNEAFTPGDWDVMCSGSYNNNSRTPPLYSAFERYSLGWIEPRELTGEGENVCLLPLVENDAYIIRTEKENEYFLLENRQKEGWDSFIPNHGMLIWHIDFDIKYWAANIVNNDPNHQRVDIEEADGTQSVNSVTGDCFPGVRKVRSFTDDTRPNMLSWSGQRQNKPITEITEENGNIYFKVSGGADDAGMTEISDDSTTFNVMVKGRMIEIENVSSSEIVVYALDGRVAARLRADRGNISFEMPASGCYIITDGMNAKKMIVY